MPSHEGKGSAQMEHKFIPFSELKAKQDGPGGWEGFLSRAGEVDDGGDLILQGAYADTIPDFLNRGFNAESHDWTFSKMIGFPVSAKEDDEGLYVVSQYHSTPDAQLVRTKVQERIAAGKGVYMSIGYEVMPQDIERINPDEYAKFIPEYSRKGLADQNLLKALQFPFIRVIRKVNLFEGSIVSVPMLRSAEVTAVKSLLDGLGTGNVEYSEHARLLVTAIGEFMGRTEARAEMRTKEGRVFSSANMSDLESMASQLEDMATRMRAMMEAAKPKPKDTQATDEGKALAQEVSALLLEHYARQPQLRALHIRR